MEPGMKPNAEGCYASLRTGPVSWLLLSDLS